jgi:hypothetical protein
LLDGVSIVRSEKVKDEVVLDGNDIELVSRSCALINQVHPLTCECFIVVHFVCCLDFKCFCFFVTEMPCQEQGYQEVSWWYLRQWEGLRSDWRIDVFIYKHMFLLVTFVAIFGHILHLLVEVGFFLIVVLYWIFLFKLSFIYAFCFVTTWYFTLITYLLVSHFTLVAYLFCAEILIARNMSIVELICGD